MSEFFQYLEKDKILVSELSFVVCYLVQEKNAFSFLVNNTWNNLQHAIQARFNILNGSLVAEYTEQVYS